MPHTEAAFIAAGWVETQRWARFRVYEYPPGGKPITRLNTESGKTRQHRNESLETLELKAVLREMTREFTTPGTVRDDLINSINGLAGELSDNVDP